MTDDHDAERHVEVEVVGTPEQVWQAIATGTGQAAWMFAADVEPVEGGEMIIHREPFGPEATTTVTSWDPPRRFGFAESVPGAPAPLATEILVEARSGGTCLVRVVCGFADAGDDWEDLVDAALEGWRMSLRVLGAYLRSFAGASAHPVDVITELDPAPTGRTAPADTLFTRLGLPDVDRVPGRSFHTAPGAPKLSGEVEYASDGYLLLRGERPYRCLIAISCFPMGLDRPMSINLMGRIYGERDDRISRIRADWRSWLIDQAGSLSEHDHRLY